MYAIILCISLKKEEEKKSQKTTKRKSLRLPQRVKESQGSNPTERCVMSVDLDSSEKSATSCATKDSEN